MGFPLHPIISPSLSKAGFQASFTAHSFPYSECSEKFTNPPKEPSIQNTTKGFSNGTCFPPHFKNDDDDDDDDKPSKMVDKLSKNSFSESFEANLSSQKHEHPSVKYEEDKKEILEVSNAIDFSLKSWKGSESKNLEVLDLSRKSDNQEICL